MKALDLAKAGCKRFPNDVDGMVVLGASLRANNELEEGIFYLDKALSFNPEYAEALINRGLIRLSQKDKVRCLSDLESAFTHKPHIKQIWDLIIDLKIEFEQFRGAIRILEIVSASAPPNEKHYARLALCNQKLGNLDAVIENYRQALKINPNFAEAYYNMGNALQDNGDLEAARDSYKHALKLKPNYAEALWNLSGTARGISESNSWIEKCLVADAGYERAKLTLAALGVYQGNRKYFNELMQSSIKDHPYMRSFAWAFTLPELPGLYFNRWSFFDADLYSSTICALNYSRPVMDEHTVLVFDEFIMNKNWEQDEFKALNEFCEENKCTYEVMAISFFTKQVAVKLIGI